MPAVPGKAPRLSSPFPWPSTPTPSQLPLGFDPPAGDARGDPAQHQGPPGFGMIVAFVCVKFLRTPAGMPPFAADLRNGVDDRLEPLAVVDVAGRDALGDRVAVSLDHQVMLCGGLSAVGRTGPHLVASLGGAYAGGVHARPSPVEFVGFLQAVENSPVETIPDSGRLPIAQSSPAGHPAHTKHRRKQLPRNAGAQHREDTLQFCPIRTRRPPSSGTGRMGPQKRFDFLPQLISNHRLHGVAHTHFRPFVRAS